MLWLMSFNGSNVYKMELIMKKLGIYIHIPFCVRKCDYCDFLSAPSDNKTMESYVKALMNEIKLNKEKMAEYLVDTVFIGGGTPSILEENLMVDVIETLKNNCNLDINYEMTIECNPGTVTEKKLQSYKKAGINRLSFGLQSADNRELASIGRIHTYEDFLDSYTIARKCGFENINIDLMSALPGQSVETYRNTLEKIIALEPEHISAYSLIIEDGTKMKDRVENALALGKNILPDEDEERNMYYLTEELLHEAGYKRYEISNYSKPGYECKHNIGYWKRKEYLGFGIGAASLYKEVRYNNVSDLKTYMDKLHGVQGQLSDNVLNYFYNDKEKSLEHMNGDRMHESNLDIKETLQHLSKEEQMEEQMFLGLRMMEGVSVKNFNENFETTFDDIYGKITSKLISQGLLERGNEHIRLTNKGIDVSNYVMSEFLLD